MSMHQNRLEGLLSCRLPDLHRRSREGAGPAPLTSSQVTRMLLVWGPHWEDHLSGPLSALPVGRMLRLKTAGELLKTQIPGANPRRVRAAGQREAQDTSGQTEPGHAGSYPLSVLCARRRSKVKKGQRPFFVSAGFREQNLSFLVKEACAIDERPCPS